MGDKPERLSIFQSSSQWLSLLRARKIGAVELLKLHLDHLERHNGAINAVVARDDEGAFAAARAADNQSSSRGLLQGLPMTIKDSFEVVGMPATCGFPFLAGYRPQQDADPVARLRAAGAVIYGKTNVPTGVFDWQSYNPIYGTTNNPWDVTRSPGGSSGGPSAAVAAGFTSLELGSDMGGSIRCPAHFCGIYGHKTSYGVINGRGHIPPMPGQFMKAEMGVFGPIARTAHDLELALDILTGPEEMQRPAFQIKLPASRRENLKEFRVALWVDQSAYAVDERCLASIQTYAANLRKLGVRVEVARPDIDWAAAYETYLSTIFQLLAGATPEPAMRECLKQAASLSPRDKSYPARMLRAFAVRHHEYLGIMTQREQLRDTWRKFFQTYDLLICPAMPTVAYPHDHRGDGENPILACEARSMIVNGKECPYFDNLQWPAVATTADLPSTAVPTGEFVEGLPVGVQVIGPYLEDRTPLRFAQLVERELGGFTPPPNLI